MIRPNRQFNKREKLEEIYNENIKQYYNIDCFNNSNLNTIRNKEAINEMIRTWFYCVKGEKLFDNNFGNDIWIYLKKDINEFKEIFNFSTWIRKLENDLEVINVIEENSYYKFNNNGNELYLEIYIIYNIKDTNETAYILLTDNSIIV